MSYNTVLRNIRMEPGNMNLGKELTVGNPRVPRKEPVNRRALGRETSQEYRERLVSGRQRVVEEGRGAANICFSLCRSVRVFAL